MAAGRPSTNSLGETMITNNLDMLLTPCEHMRTGLRLHGLTMKSICTQEVQNLCSMHKTSCFISSMQL